MSQHKDSEAAQNPQNGSNGSMKGLLDTPPPGVYRTDSSYREQFQEIAAGKFESVVAKLKLATDPRLKHPFYIRGYSEKGATHEIPVNPLQYSRALLAVATEPQSEEGTVYKRVDFGYNIYGDFRRIGFINHLRMDSEGSVAEVGFGSELARDYFLHHLFGRTSSPEVRERIRVVQEEVFAYLRSSPAAQEKLQEFSRSRGWPAGLEDVAGLAYFDNRITSLEELAALKGISDEEMYLAGWYDLSFTQSGQSSYSVRDFKVIRIPYFKDGRTEVWRTRNLRPSRATSHKYTSWPLDRSVEREFCVEEKLYYGWELEKAKRQKLVITEGEFKCLVATQASGILTVGIPGITEVDETIIQALVKADASEYIVVLDRDPRGKGFMRVDGITDSERAAYGIAMDLQRAGAKNVHVGRIPNARNGQKVGIDDLILDQGVEAYLHVINDALDPQHYAKAIGLSETFFLLMQSRQQIKKALEQYEHSVRRGGQHVDEEVYEDAIRLRDEIEQLYADFLLERFRGAFRIDQPSRENMVFFRTSSIEDADKKIAMAQNGEGFALEHFQNDIIFFHYFPADTPRALMWIGKNDLMFPLSMQDITRFFKTGVSESRDLPLLLRLGLEVLGKTPEDGQSAQWESVHDVGRTLLAGYVSRDFPQDEFTFIPDLTFYVNRGTHWDEHVRIPLAIFKKSSGEAVAFVNLTTWEDRDDTPNALMLDNRMVLFASSFLRQRDTFHDETKFRMVTETLYPYWSDRKKQETVEMMARFGIAEEMVERYKLLALSPTDYQELIDHFAFRRLLNQATNSGLFRWNEHTKIIPRFNGDTILLPVFDENRDIVSLRVLPLTIEDHVPPASDPSQKLIRQIDGGDRHLLRNLDPERQLYMQDRLRGVKGKQLLVTLHELDGLILGSRAENVVSLNHALEFHPDIIAKIRSAAPERICFVISGQTPHSRYDDFNFDTIHGFIKDLYDAQETMNASRPENTPPISFFLTVLPFPLTHLSDGEVSAITGSSVNLQSYLNEHKFNPSIHTVVQRFLSVNSRLLDYLEVRALPDLLDARPIEWWIKENKRLYAAIQHYAKQTHQITLPGVESYFQNKLHLDQPLSIEELVRLRREEGKMFLHKPLYTLERRAPASVSDEFHRLFHQVVIERTPVSVQDIRNILFSPAPEAPRREKQTPSPVEAVACAAPTIQNAKGALLAFHQRSPTRFSRPEVVQETKSGDAFTLTLRVRVSDGKTELIGRGRALRKRDAEALASEQILQQMRKLEVPLSSSPTDGVAVANPKGKVYEILQKATPSLPKPSITSKQFANGFSVTATLSYNGRVYSGKGIGKTKKEAEKEAFIILLDKMEGRRNLTGLNNEEATEIERALQMPAGDKNYIGHIHRIAQIIHVRPPQFITTFYLTEEGTAYQTHVSLQLTDDLTIETEANSLFHDVSRQQAALNLLSKLSEVLSEDNSSE